MLDRVGQFISEQIVDDDKRMVVQFNVAYFLFFSIAVIMSIVNYLTGNVLLMLATMAFAVCCMFDFGLSRLGKGFTTVANVCFSVEIVALFIFFLVTGMPDGFSVIWVCMLPSFGMLLYRRSRTTIICAIMFVVLVFFFWIPYGQSLLKYEYNDAFMLRFPMMFVGFYVISLALETFRLYTQRELIKAKTQYAQLYKQDELTGLYNRRGFVNVVNEIIATEKTKELALVLIDIDHFTDINGKYGHVKGDLVLKELAKLIKENFNFPASRWGDDKFAIFCGNGALSEKKLKDFCEYCAKQQYDKDGVKFGFTISIGGAFSYTENKPEELFKQANRCLYKAKTEARGSACFVHL